jgi:hypothetical protein
LRVVRGMGSQSECALVPGGGLMAHEVLDGGHTLAKHVGKSEEFLRHRLATKLNLDIASTFFDRRTAESALSGLLKDNADEIRHWLAGGTPSFILIGRTARPVGVVVARGGAGSIAASGIRLVLRRSATMSTGYRIHTAMVEL